jgi:ribonuclease-3
MRITRKALLPFRKSERDFSRAVKSITKIRPYDLSLYEKAFKHSSYSSSKFSPIPSDNQRLEFLGDAILGGIAAEYLYNLFPERDEGFLTNLRSKIVSRKSLNKIAKELGLGQLVKKKLDKNKKAHSIYGDALEALIGAIYLDRGLKHANQFVLKQVIEPHWDIKSLETHVISYKSAFIEWAQKEKIDYSIDLLKQWGVKHDLTFETSISIDGNEISRGEGSSKKRAEENAAMKACQELKII